MLLSSQIMECPESRTSGVASAERLLPAVLDLKERVYEAAADLDASKAACAKMEQGIKVVFLPSYLSWVAAFLLLSVSCR